MPVVTAPVALTVAAPAGLPGTQVVNEQNFDVTNGNKFDNPPGTLCLLRNTTVSAIVIQPYADVGGIEVLLPPISVPGTATQNGEVIAGPFPSQVYNDHAQSIAGATAQGTVILKQMSGSAGQVKVHPFTPNLSAAR